MTTDKLAILGGKPVIAKKDDWLFHWPVVNEAMKRASTKVLEEGSMSGTDRSREFEEKFAKWQGRKYALTFPNGTSALTTAFWTLGIGRGDEVVCTTLTYWASCLGAVTLGAKVRFCDCRRDTLCMDPASFEAAITKRTKAVIVVHLSAHPCDMDAIMRIANRHHIAVIEDVSHAQGGHYKGKMLGTFGKIAAMSLMSGKSFAIGEGGMLVTDDFEIYRKAIRYGHYDRIPQFFSPKEIALTKNLPFGAYKHRLNQCASAVGLEQLKKYDRERKEIEKAMLYFWKQVGDVPGISLIYPKEKGSDKAGWYASRFAYDPEAFDGLTNITFSRALSAEVGGGVSPGGYQPLHMSSLFGKQGRLPVADRINEWMIGDLWFKHFDRKALDLHAAAFRKVAANWKLLKPLDRGVKPYDGGAGLSDFEKRRIKR